MKNSELLESLIYKKVDYQPESTTDSLEKFLESTIYRDFLSEIACRIEDMKHFYEEADRQAFLETKGGLRAMRMVASIFVDLVENSKQKSEDHGE